MGDPDESKTARLDASSGRPRQPDQELPEIQIIVESPEQQHHIEPHKKQPDVQLADFVGEHGAYQLAITALLFMRYVMLGLMANSGPQFTPDVTYYCSLPMSEIIAIMPNISTMSQLEQEREIKEEFKSVCQLDSHLYQDQSQLSNNSRTFKTTSVNKVGNLNLNLTAQIQRPQQQHNSSALTRECIDFTYDLAPDQGRTMTSEFDLVCDRFWLRSLFQSLLSASIVVAYVFWGTFSDKYGRFQAQRLCMLISLVAGVMSMFVAEFWIFLIMRALCSFGDLGLVVSQTTIVVELVGQKYRGLSVAVANFGQALGVCLLPYLVAYFEDFRVVISFTVLCHLITMPLMLATNESPRWLLVNKRFKYARKELKRIAKFNKTFNLFVGNPIMEQHDEDGQQQQHQSSKRSSSKQRRQKFESLFKQLIDQIESQGLFDLSATDTAEHKQQQPLPSPRRVIVRQPQPIDRGDGANQTEQTKAGQQVKPSVAEAYLAKSANCSPIQTRFVGGRVIVYDTSGTEQHSTKPSSIYKQTVIRLNSEHINNLEAKTEDRDSGSGSLDGVEKKDDLLQVPLAPGVLRKAASCDHLLNVSDPNNLPINTANDRIEDQQSRLMKTLTLPVVSQASSIYSDDDDGASSYEGLPIRRRFINGQLEQHKQPDCITSCQTVAHQLSFVGRVSRLFKDKKLMVAVFTIVWITFNSELLYTSFIIINLEVGEDVLLNYALGGCMEALAAVSASLLLSYSPRRVSLIAFWLLISISCFGLSLAHVDSTWAVWMLALAKFSQSALSSIAAVAAYESFPTFLRQSGSGLVFTLGMMGSVFAPLISAEFDDEAGMDRVLMIFSFLALKAAIMIHLFLTETRGVELQ